MNIKVFKGIFFEIGQQQGKIYKANRMDFNKVKIDPICYKNQFEIYQAYYPQLLEELRGIAKGGNFDEKKLIYDFITSEIFYYRNKCGLDKACTIFGHKEKNNLFVGRNYDWIPETTKFFEVYKYINPKTHSFFAITDMGVENRFKARPKYFYYNADDVINDQGLFVGITFAYADQWNYGVSCMHMTKIIAETCSTVKGAIEVFNRVPICCPKNFFIADKYGTMAVIEHTSRNFKVLYPKNNTLIQTNHYVDNKLSREDTVLIQAPEHDTFIRYYETLQNINLTKGKFELSSVAKILRRAGSYTYQNSSHFKTIWTLALDMTGQKYKIYWGCPKKKHSRLLA